MISQLAIAATLLAMSPSDITPSVQDPIGFELPSPDEACPVGVCGRTRPAKASGRSFDKKVLQAERPVLVEFTAPWCAPCRRLEPTLEELASDRGDEISVVKVQVDDNQRLAEQYGVRWVPTLLLFQQGELVERRTGAATRRTLERWIESSLPGTLEDRTVLAANQESRGARGSAVTSP